MYAGPGYAQETTESSPFECQPSIDENRTFTTPKIPESYFNPDDVAELRTSDNQLTTSQVGGETYPFHQHPPRVTAVAMWWPSTFATRAHFLIFKIYTTYPSLPP